MKITPISQAEMARQLERLKEVRVADRYSIGDMAILTGWTPTYLARLEKDGRIPIAPRTGELRGDPGHVGDHRRAAPDKRGRSRQWTEEQARVILGFKRAQDYKFRRLSNGGH